MRALLNTDDGPTVVEDYTLASSIRPGEATISLEIGGVCATDIEVAQGYMGFRGVMGHEWVGVVEDAGNGDPLWVGQRVVGDINCPCGLCQTCSGGRPTHCPTRTVLGIVGRDGAFSERFHLPAANLHRVPDGVSSEAAAFVEPLAAACQILEQVHIRPTDRVAVLGMGRLGLMCSSTLALGGAHVVGIGRSDRHLNRLPPGVEGATLADFRAGSVGSSGSESSSGGPKADFDVVVDCTGNPHGLGIAGQLVRSRGTIVLKTTVHEQSPVNPTPWVLDEVTLVGSRCGPFEPALRLLARGLVDPTPWITGRFGLAQANQALIAAAKPEHVKVLIDARPHANPAIGTPRSNTP